MRKQGKQLIILLLVLVLLIAGFFGVKKYNEIQTEKPEEESGVAVIEVAKEDIISFSYDYEGITYSFEKEEDTWHYTGDRSLSIDQTTIAVMLNRVAPFTAEQGLGEVSDFNQYGLEEPLKTITYSTADQSYTIQIGGYNSVATVYYAKLAGDNKVYTVISPVKTVFDRDMEDWVEKEESAEKSAAENVMEVIP